MTAHLRVLLPMMTFALACGGGGGGGESGAPLLPGEIRSVGVTGLSNCVASDLNDRTEVIGFCNDAETPTAAFRWTPDEAGRRIDRIDAPGESVDGINNAGEIIGSVLEAVPDDGLPELRSFIVADGDFSRLPIDQENVALGVNDIGQVVGLLTSLDAPERVFVFQEGRLTLIRSEMTPSNIGHDGTIVGSSGSGPVVIRNGVEMTLDTFGGPFGDAVAVNRFGEVAGFADTDETFLCGRSVCNFGRAFIATAGSDQVEDLGTLGGKNAAASDINDLGYVVGFSETEQGTSRAFVWHRRFGMKNLSSLLPAGSGWTLELALAINERNEIVGSGTLNGRPEAYVFAASDILQAIP